LLVVTSRASTKAFLHSVMDNQLITHMEDLVSRIKLDPPQVKNVEFLEVDEEILCPERTWESDESGDESDEVRLFNEEEEEELVRAVEEGLITPPSSEVETGTLPLQLIHLFK
jgi:DNA-directed RNA polymerase specialized sigma24 family protein